MVAAPKKSSWYVSQTWSAHGWQWSFTYYEISARRVIENSDRSISLNIPCSDAVRHASPQMWLEKWAKSKAGQARLGKLQPETTHQLNFLRGKVEGVPDGISPKKKNSDKCLDISLSSVELVGSRRPPNESEELPRSSSSKLTPMPDTLQGEALASEKQRSHSKDSSISITSNSFLGESEPPIFLGENLEQNDLISKISPKKKTGNPASTCEKHSPSEIFLGENDRPRSSQLISPKKNPSGSLYAFIQDKKDRYGNVKTYPKVEGDRSTGNPDHWFWAYCWDEKVNGKWKTFKRSVPREKLSKVRMAIDANQPVSEILKIIG
jgi:hypothetical protein